MATSVKQWFVYVVECADGTLYTGVTTDLARRIKEHNGELPGGAKYTKARRPVTQLYHEACVDRSEAGKREYELRMLSATQKRQLGKCANRK